MAKLRQAGDFLKSYTEEMKEARAELAGSRALLAQADTELHALTNSRVDAALAEPATAKILGPTTIRKLAAELKESLYR